MSMSKLKSDLRLKTPFRCNLSSCSPLGHVTEPPPEIAIVLPDQKKSIAHMPLPRTSVFLPFFRVAGQCDVAWAIPFLVVAVAGSGPGTDVGGTRTRSWH